MIERAKSGIESLDELLIEGLPKPSSIMLITPRTRLINVICAKFLIKGFNLGEGGIYITTQETPKEIKEEAQEFNLNLADYERKGLLSFIDCYSLTHGLKLKDDVKYALKFPEGLNDFFKLISHTSRKIESKTKVKSIRLVLNSFSDIINAFKQDKKRTFSFARELQARLRTTSSLSLSIIYKGLHESILESMIYPASDIVLELKRKSNEAFLRIRKCHKTLCKNDWFKLKFDLGNLILI